MEVGGFAAEAAAQSLAVDGDLAALRGETETGEMLGDASGKGGGFDGLGQCEPLAQPIFLQLAELFHEIVGPNAAEYCGEGDEEDLAEMVKRVAAVPRVANGGEDLEAGR